MYYDCHYFGPVLDLFSPTLHNCSYIQYSYSSIHVLGDVDISVFVRVYSRICLGNRSLLKIGTA